MPVAGRPSGGGLSLAAGRVLDAALSFAGAEMMTVRVVVDVRPALSDTTYSII